MTGSCSVYCPVTHLRLPGVDPAFPLSCHYSFVEVFHMLFKGTLIGPASGKLNGLVASHNKGGSYFRKLSIPTNTNTAQQQAVRNALKTLAGNWALDLTPTQRAAWDTFAANVARINALGDTIHISGNSWFIACNTPRLQASMASVFDGPGVYALPTFTLPVMTITAGGTTGSLAFTNTDDWANEDGGALLVFASKPANPGRNFFNGPYQLAGIVLGDAGTAPTSPATITLPFPTGLTDTKQFFRYVITRADGRLSSPQLQTAVAP